VDVVLSCALPFSEAINDGLPHYQLTLPFALLRDVFQQQRRGQGASITLGASGVAEVCRVARARYFLPYAHGFAGLGVAPPNEDEAMRLLSAELLGSSISVERWQPGDYAVFRGGRLHVRTPTRPST
jgi:hypothetical protein